MRKYLFLVISLCLLFAGCDNFFSKGNGNSNLGSSVLRLELAQNKKQSKTARTISPANGNPFSDVDVWKIEFISPSYTDTQENVSFTNGAYDVQLPVGTYTINIEGVITDKQTLAQIVWVGSASNVEVIAGETVSAEIQVSLKKEGKGSFIYTVDLNLPNPEYVGDFVVELKNQDNGNIISVSQGSPSEEFGNASTDGSVAMKNIPAGFYKINIKYLDMSDGKYHSALLPDPLVEIIGNVVLSGTSQAIQLGTSRVYYATTDASDYNGLTENNPANFYSLIHMLAESSDWEDVKIYCDDKPDTAAINAGDIAKIQKEIKVYCSKVLRFTIKDKNIDTGFVEVSGVTITGGEIWDPASSVFVSGRQLTIPDLIVCDHEVTRGEFTTVMGDPVQQFMTDLADYLTNVYDKDGNTVTGDALLNIPMSRVNWYHAMAYCNKLSLKEGLTPCYSVEGIDDWGYLKFTDIPGYSSGTLTEEQQNLVAPWNAATCDFSANGYRLPTEAEWEWLARGGNDHTEFAGSNNIDEVAWYEIEDYGPHLVKLLKPNGYGLYDMTGNVYEMCWDKDAYPITSTTPATGGDTDFWRVVRGGSYYTSDENCSLSPSGNYPNNFSEEKDYVMCYDYGFRVVRTNSPVVGYEGSGSASTNVDTFNWYETPIDADTGLAATSSSTSVYFGVFPKTVVPASDATKIKETITKTVGAYTYYGDGDGNWYAKADENANGASYTYSDGSTVKQASASSTRYFKVEPITWKVVTPNYNSSGKALLMAENVLTASIPFYETTTARNINGTVYANNYKYSTVRAYLNGKYETGDTQTDKYTDKGFLQTAFTTTAQSLIANTEVKNSADTASYDSSITLKLNTCEDTVDKIFLLSLSEVTNEAYGFDPYRTTSNADLNTTRHRTPTDFAKANNVIISSNRATWWLRSPYGTESTASTEAVRTVTYQGAVNGNGPANTMYYGLLPALTIELQ